MERRLFLTNFKDECALSTVAAVAGISINSLIVADLTGESLSSIFLRVLFAVPGKLLVFPNLLYLFEIQKIADRMSCFASAHAMENEG